MPAPYILQLSPVVGIDSEATTTPSEELVLVLTPVLKGDAGSGGGTNLEAGSGILIESDVVSVDTAIISTKAYAETVASAALASANAATGLVQDLAETNVFKISQLEGGFDTLEQTVEDNFNLLSSSKADQSALETLQNLVDTKATPVDITAAIADLVGAAPEALDTLYELAAALQGEQAVIDAILIALGNCVRFDAAQSLTVPQKDQARSNIDAEKTGVAAGLVAAITPESIGAASAAQGTKADTAIQSGDLAPVALSGIFNALTGKSALFDLAYSAYVIGSNIAIAATDTLGQMLGKLQAQINAKEPTIAAGTTAQYWRGDKSWQTLPAASAPKTFNQSRWDFTNFDTQNFSGGYTLLASSGTLMNPSTFKNSDAVNDMGWTGFTVNANNTFVCVTSQGFKPQTGRICRTIFVWQDVLQDMFHGFMGLNTTVINTATTYIGFAVNSAGAKAICYNNSSGSSNNGTQSFPPTAVAIPAGVSLVADIEYLTDSSARLVLWNLATNAKYIDTTFKGNGVPALNVPNLRMAHRALVTVPTNYAAETMTLGYMGRGIARPPEIVTPA